MIKIHENVQTQLDQSNQCNEQQVNSQPNTTASLKPSKKWKAANVLQPFETKTRNNTAKSRDAGWCLHGTWYFIHWLHIFSTCSLVICTLFLLFFIFLFCFDSPLNLFDIFAWNYFTMKEKKRKLNAQRKKKLKITGLVKMSNEWEKQLS